MESLSFRQWAERISDDSTREVAKELCRQFEQAQAEKERTLVEVAELRSENQRLQRELRELSPSGRPVEGARGASPWWRWTQALLNKQELRRNVDSVQSQLQKLGEDEGAALLAWVPEMLSRDHVLVNVSQAYSSLGTAMQRRRTALMKAVAAGMRTHMVWLWACAGGCGFAAFDAALAELFGERYHASGPDPNFRSQFCGAFRQLFPGERRARRRSNRSRQPDRNGPQRSASSSPEPHSAEEPEGEATPRASREPTPWEPESPEPANGHRHALAETGFGYPIRDFHMVVNKTFIDVIPCHAADEKMSIKSDKTFPRRAKADEVTEFKEKTRLISELVKFPAPENGSSDARLTEIKAQRLSEIMEKPQRAVAHKEQQEQEALDDNKQLVEAIKNNASSAKAVGSLLEGLSYVTSSPRSFLSDISDLMLWFRQKEFTSALATSCERCGEYFSSDDINDGSTRRAMAHEVLSVLLETMELLPDCEEAQEAALKAVLKVVRSQGLVLGVCCSPEPTAEAECLPERSRIKSLAESAAQRHANCWNLALQVIVRTHDLRTVQEVVAAGCDRDLVMEEIIYHLKEPLRVLNDYDTDQQAWASNILRQIAQHGLGASLLPDVNEWVTASNSPAILKERFLLNGALSGADAGILTPLKASLERAGKGKAYGQVIIDLLTSACRAIISLNDYVLELTPEIREAANTYICEIVDTDIMAFQHRYWAITPKLCSALAGVLGSINRGRGDESGLVLQHLLDLAAVHMRRWMNAAQLHHEVLWAFTEISPEGARWGEWTKPVRKLASNLQSKWSEAVQGGPGHTGESQNDEEKVVEFSAKILAQGRSPTRTRTRWTPVSRTERR